jgi:hypothetical protein
MFYNHIPSCGGETDPNCTCGQVGGYDILTIPGEEPDAMCKPFTSGIFVTTKGMRIWTMEELKGVVAHEDAHKQGHHPEIKLVMIVIMGIYRTERLFRGKGWTGKVWIPNLVEKTITNSFSYITERIADKHAKDMGYGSELASALNKVHVTPLQRAMIFLGGNLHPTFKNRIKTDHQYKTNLENVWAVGDCVALHWPEQMAMGGYRHPDLAHVAHHEAVLCVERIAGHERHDIDYKNIPGCTYTHPQVASMGATEKKLREQGRQLRVGKFPFSASGRALAAGETDGFVKLIFDAKYGELLGVHMIGENVTEMLSELVLARKLEATEEEILDAIHPHPTMSEAVMEAAGASVGKAIHI